MAFADFRAERASCRTTHDNPPHRLYARRMALKPDIALEALTPVILTAFPELAGSRFSLLNEGWDSAAVDVDDALIFKFPRHARAEEALIRESRLLAAVAPAVTMTLPRTTLHEGERLFSRHAKLKGEHLVAADYDRLPLAARDRLARDMARFFAELHRLDHGEMRAAGALAIGPWHDASTIERDIAAVLPTRLQDFAERTLGAWAALPPDPLDETFGYFDGHGWNMAFDHARHRLNGLFDFGDSGFGAVHREFVYPGFVARDLAWRIADAYEPLSGRCLDRNRIETLTAVLRLDELAGAAGDPAMLPAITAMLERWAAGL
ncbi:hypothetical protein sos41_04500 [Alphaproteobacteria bacterium SO-S41]|nr:hypothetical protein sos41_04500 [Alphaproteobacteria bacterium SO-S41]